MRISRPGAERPRPLHSQHPPFHRCEKPVLLLYGLFATPRIVDVLTHRFRRRGYCAFSINLGGLFGRFNSAPIEELAALVSNQVDRICRHHGLEWLDIVGHSEGGLIGRYYVQKLNGAKHVSSLVTLGTPHRGTPWAYLGRLVKQIIPSVPQMMPNSHFLRECTDRSFPGGVKMHHSEYPPSNGPIVRMKSPVQAPLGALHPQQDSRVSEFIPARVFFFCAGMSASRRRSYA